MIAYRGAPLFETFSRPPATVRERLEAQIDQLIEMLDAFDGDPDLEDNADAEPSLGQSPVMIGGRLQYDLERDDGEEGA